MNVGTYLLFTVPLVGGSLFAYDSLRARPPEHVESEVGSYAAPPPRTESRAETGPMLQGDPTAQIERLVQQALEKALREQRASGTARVAAPEAAPTEALPTLPPIQLPETTGGAEGPVTNFDERTLTTLRSYMDEVERRKREARLHQMVAGQIDRLGVSLTDSQKQAVIDATLKHNQAVREAMRSLPPGQENREARTKLVQDLREQYSKQVYDIAPAAEAEKIVNSLGQGWRGVVGGMGDGNGGGGGRAGRPGAPGDGR